MKYQSEEFQLIEEWLTPLILRQFGLMSWRQQQSPQKTWIQSLQHKSRLQQYIEEFEGCAKNVNYPEKYNKRHETHR